MTIFIIIALILISGFFSLFARALRIVRKPRLRKEAQRYHRVIKALENSDSYFMTARFWIISFRTCAAVLAGLSVGRLASAAPTLLLTAACITLFIIAVLLLSGFLPRLIAGHAPEALCAAIIPLFELCAIPLRPFYRLIQKAGERLHIPLLPPEGQSGMTEDELRLALMEGEKSGIVESKERTMVEGVFYLGDRPLGAFMTHRSDIQWLDINAPPDELRAKVLEYREQRCFPVADGALDAIIGAAYLEDIILGLVSATAESAASAAPAGLRTVMKKPLFAPETMPALKAFESFKRGKADFLFAMDEYGGFAGMVSVHDLMEEIVGELAASAGEEERAVQQEDGSWLADGGLNIDYAAKLLSLPGLSAASDDYHTLAGFVLSLAGELPRPGDSFEYQGCRFTVMGMEGNRIEKIAVRKENQGPGTGEWGNDEQGRRCE
ncbi:MAG: hemolysin family protein [Treponema sp.]|nr:hemolysin family protein [Treponema sp.]